MAPASVVLLTGGTGHIGSRVLVLALRAGYQVRLAVRSQKRGEDALRMLSNLHQISDDPKDKVSRFDLGRVSFAIVPDMAAPNCYDEAVKGVDAIIHLASPITTGGAFDSQDHFEKYFLLPAKQGVLSLLEAAKKEPSVKRVVITSSIVSLAPFDEIFLTETPNVIQDDAVAPVDNGPYPSEYHAYSASKNASHRAAQDFMRERRPAFDLVILSPGWVLGADHMQTDAEKSITGTNAAVIKIALGKDVGFKTPSAIVHSEDVARSHVEALNKEKIPAGVYTLVSNPSTGMGTPEWEKVAKIAEAVYPEEFAKGIFKTGGVGETNKVKIDGTKASKTFGFQYLGIEDMVANILGHYLRLRKV